MLTIMDILVEMVVGQEGLQTIVVVVVMEELVVPETARGEAPMVH